MIALPLALWLSLGAPPAPHAADTGTVGRQSLEELLERARKERQAAQQRVAGDVEALVKELESGPEPRELAAKVERLVALGEDATPLLVLRIDPGAAATDKEKLRALQVANALARMDTGAVTTDLIEVLRGGTAEGRRNALRALTTTREVARVRPEVERLFRSSEGQTKQAALKTLLALGGDQNDALLTELLGGGDDALIGLAIDGLADQKVASAADAVRKVLTQPQSAPRHAGALLRYFQAVPQAVTQADVLAFVRLAQSATLPLEMRVSVVDGLAGLGPTLNVELKKAMEPVVTSSDRRLRESALVLLARLGDKTARRDLTREYDDLVAKNERWADAFVRRADMYARLGDDDEAIKDYKQALSVGKDDPTLPQDQVSEKLARCYVRKGKLKDASDLLNRAPISMARLRELAEDPEFAPLRASKYGKDAFGLK